MKKSIVIFLVILAAPGVFAQSRSYQVLQAEFQGKDDVHQFSLGGVLCKLAVRMMGQKDPAIKSMTKDIRHIRFIVMPKSIWMEENLSFNAFRKYVSSDSFDEMMSVRDHGDHVYLYHRKEVNKKDTYLILIEEEREIVAIEMRGYVDPSDLVNGNGKLVSKM